MKKYVAGIWFICLSCFLLGKEEVHKEKREEQSNEMYAHCCSEEEISMFMKALSCGREQAESIVRSVNRQGTGRIGSGFRGAVRSEETGGWIVTAEDEQKETYLFYIDRNFHLYAIQMDCTDGEYIYQELE